MKIDLKLDYQTILANRARPVHFALQFQAESLSTPRPRPAAFCVVLGHSGSMEGLPLGRAKEASTVAIRNLRRDDLFSLVTFETSARVVIPLQRCQDKAALIAAVQKIISAGSTNLTGGWMLGRDELKKAPSEASRRLLLLSDGLLNEGIVDPEQVRQIVAAGLQVDQVRTSTLGFGDSYDEKLMSDLATVTNGQFYDVDSPEKLPAIFAHELEGLQRLAVQNLRVRVKRLDFCEGIELLSTYPVVELPDGRKEIAVGDMVSEKERILCFGLEVLPLPCVQGAPVASLEGEKLLEVEILYDEIEEARVVSRTQQQVMRIQATPNPDEVVANETVVGWVAMQRAGLTIRRATDELTGGSPQKAKLILEQAVALLSEHTKQPKVAEALQMLQDLLTLVDEGYLSPRQTKAQYSSHFHSSKGSSRLPPGYGGTKPPTPPTAGHTPQPPPPSGPNPAEPGASGPTA